MKTLWKENKTLCVITIISVIIVLSYNLTYDMPEIVPGIGLWYTLLYDLSLGVLINFMFFIFQLFIPSRKKQKAAFKIAKSKLEWLYFLISDITLSTDKFIKINADDSIETPHDICYFIRHDINSDSGWLIRIDFSSDGIGLYLNQIEKTLNDITSNFSYSNNDYELIENLSKLQNNNYIKHLKHAVENPNNRIRYENINNAYHELKTIMLYLGDLLNKSCLEVCDASKTNSETFEKRYRQFSENTKKGIPREYLSIKK